MAPQGLNNRSVSIVGRDPSGREIARRLAAAAGLEVVEPGPGAGGPSLRAALLHLPVPSESALEEARRLVRELAPLPVVALSAGCGEGGCVDLRNLGLAGCVPVSPDDEQTGQSIARVLSTSGAEPGDRCPLCPLGVRDDTGPVCTSFLQDSPGNEWTGHDAGGAQCFPFVAGVPSMLELAKLARRVATSDATVLITGESGTGKEVLARYIHRSGNRGRAPFVKVNCAALPDSLLESELFGHEKGAFTGAAARKAGRFETAEGGIIFLDEISEMSLGLQAKLLQVLEAKTFHRLGGLDEIEVDVQILAATNRGLEREMSLGRFREDLYFRLRVIELHLPPLRERRRDIPRLSDYFLCRLSRQHSQPVPVLSPTLRDLMRDAPWPGNVRELENALRRLVVLGEEGPLLEDLSRANGANSGSPSAGVDVEAPGEAVTTREGLNLKEIARRAARQAEKEAILATLEETRWNRSRAARRLGVSYKTLLTKMKDLLPPEA